jgi:hypothetical protein
MCWKQICSGGKATVVLTGLTLLQSDLVNRSEQDGHVLRDNGVDDLVEQAHSCSAADVLPRLPSMKHRMRMNLGRRRDAVVHGRLVHDPVQRCREPPRGVLVRQYRSEPVKPPLGGLVNVTEQHDTRSCHCCAARADRAFRTLRRLPLVGPPPLKIRRARPVLETPDRAWESTGKK